MSQKWLLRSSRDGRFQILGPMGRDEVIRSIGEGKVTINDEACPANGYWFSFHESEELHRHMGISWSQIRREAGEEELTGEEATRQSSEDEGETDEITVSSAVHPSPVSGGAYRSAQSAPSEPEPGADPGLFGVPVWGWWVISVALFALVVRFL